MRLASDSNSRAWLVNKTRDSFWLKTYRKSFLGNKFLVQDFAPTVIFKFEKRASSSNQDSKLTN